MQLARIAVMCTASARSSSQASSSSCTSSIAEAEDSDVSEPSDPVPATGDVFVPPRPVTAPGSTSQRHVLRWGADNTPKRKPGTFEPPSTAAERRPRMYVPKTAARDPPASGWQTRPAKPKATATSSKGVFKAPKTPPVSASARPANTGSRIPRTVPGSGGDDQRPVDPLVRPSTAAVGHSDTARTVTPPPLPPAQKLHSSGSDLALNGSGSSLRTQSRIPTRTRHAE